MSNGSNLNEDYMIIKNSGLFDEEWFLNKYSLDGSIDPILYYLACGVEEGLNPSADFDTLWYLEEYPSVKGAYNPLIHYIKWGKDSGWFPKSDPLYLKYKLQYFTILRSGLFDEEWFLNEYSLDIDVHPIFYYLEHGVEEGLNPSADFDTLWYLEEYPDVASGGYNPLLHYINFGGKIGWFPKPDPMYIKYRYEYFTILRSDFFDEDWFLNEYSLDIDVHPILYYLEHGVEEGLNPSADFDTLWYLEEYPDVASEGYNPLFHYITLGMFKGYLPKQFTFDSKYATDYGIILGSGLFDEDWFKNQYSLDDSVDSILYYLEHGVEEGLNPSADFDTLWYLNEYSDVKDSYLNPFAHYIKYGKNNGYLPKVYEISQIDDLPLKKSFRGKNHYFFLVNDSNNELKQHFDKNYEHTFSVEKFNRDYYFKKKLFNKLGMDYFYFFVPDKSVVCNELLPIIHDLPIRNVDKLQQIPDFSKNLKINDFWKVDSHLNLNGAKKLSFNILNYIDDSFKIEDYNSLLNDCTIENELDPSDLLREQNSSYSLLDRQKIKRRSLQNYIPKDLVFKSIPEKFEKCGIRDSEYMFNPKSFSDLRVLIFRDSSLSNMKNYLSLYFREMFLYWDHLDLNKELIGYFKPDMILEIRIERFMEGYETADWINELINYKI